MKPGRELDALVAEKVMGHSIFGDNEVIASEKYVRKRVIAHYSTEIKYAWEVLDKIKDMKGTENEGLVLRWDSDYKNWEVGFFMSAPYEGEFFVDESPAKSESAPHAICLAALKVKGVEYDL